MLRYFYLYSFAIVLLISCNNEDSKYLAPNIEIESEELRNAILEYDDSLHHSPRLAANISNSNYLLSVHERNINDSVTKYSISFSLHTWLLQDNPVWLAKIEDKYVVFYPSNNYSGILSTDKQLHKKIAYRYFPEEYKRLEKGKSLNCFIINDTKSLVLTFVRGKLVTKEISYGI